jgi:arogenate dehydrogenase (NADP+)
MRTISIIGFGRFGKTLYRLIGDDFHITIYSRSEIAPDAVTFNKNTKITKKLEEVYESEVIFYAVPISEFEHVIKSHKKYFKEEHVLIDVLSVKVHPEKIFTHELKDLSTQALLTHPMFGPDSSKDGFAGLPFIIDKFKSQDETYTFWKNYFTDKQLRIIEMTASEHDKLAANSQGLTHFIGRLLERVAFKPTIIDSLGSKKLQEIEEQTCNDTWQLFHDLQTYNPYTKDMRLRLGKAYDDLYSKLLPERVSSKHFVYGIQGGIGSFNEQALETYVTKNIILDYKIDYLYTTEKVLRNLHEGNIDFGLFAITNSTGGLVEETIQALTKYQCSIIEDFEILIKHFLMKRKDAVPEELDTIMAHPQVLKQCERTLAENYSKYTLMSGDGDLVDTAKAAEQLAQKNIPKNVAILGPVNLATRYDFDIIAENLQDKKDNFTRFLLVKR